MSIFVDSLCVLCLAPLFGQDGWTCDGVHQHLMESQRTKTVFIASKVINMIHATLTSDKALVHVFCK